MGETPLILSLYVTPALSQNFSQPSQHLTPLSYLSLSLNTRSSLHQREAHSDGVLTYATILQRLLQVDNLPAACVCVLALYNCIFAGGCEDITGLLLYSGDCCFPPPSHSLVPPWPHHQGDEIGHGRLPYLFSIWLLFLGSELMPSCPPWRHYILSCRTQAALSMPIIMSVMDDYKLHSYLHIHKVVKL